MTIRPTTFLNLALAFVVLLVLGWLATTRPRGGGPIVIYVVDALRPDRMSVYGAPRATTPAAAAFSTEAASYTNAFAVSTWTRPSVATLLTSVLPSRAGTVNRWGQLDSTVWYLPQAFQRRGWTTAAFVGNGNLFDERLGFQRGFDRFRPIVHRATGDWHPTAREVVDPAVTFIERQSSPQFFLYVHVVDPHAPYILEPSYRAIFADDNAARGNVPDDYDRSVRQADDQFQRLVDALHAQGFWSTSTIVYTADHGEEFGEHGGASHGATVYDEQLRIPLLIKYPDGDGKGTQRDDPVNLADITPTIAELHDLTPSPDWVGASLWRHRFAADRDLYFTEDLDNHRLYGLRRGYAKVVVRLYPDFSRTIYSLDRDPQERAGIAVPCNAANAPEAPLLQALARWRERDVAGYPSIRLDGGSAGRSCQSTIELSNVEKPFLTAEHYCEWSGVVMNERLVVNAQPGSNQELVYISADDHGRAPRVVTTPGRSPCPLLHVGGDLLDGPISEEYLQRLRALGYSNDVDPIPDRLSPVDGGYRRGTRVNTAD